MPKFVVAGMAVVVLAAGVMLVAVEQEAPPGGPKKNPGPAKGSAGEKPKPPPPGSGGKADSSATGPLEVRRNAGNIVAGRLEGAWEVRDAINKRLGGEETKPVAFEADEAIAASIPEARRGALPNRPVFLAGRLTREGASYPFLLTAESGNTKLVYFVPKDGDLLGGIVSVCVSLAPAKDSKGDLLFLGGDSPDKPFSAYGRAAGKNPAENPAAQPGAEAGGGGKPPGGTATAPEHTGGKGAGAAPPEKPPALPRPADGEPALAKPPEGAPVAAKPVEGGKTPAPPLKPAAAPAELTSTIQETVRLLDEKKFPDVVTKIIAPDDLAHILKGRTPDDWANGPFARHRAAPLLEALKKVQGQPGEITEDGARFHFKTAAGKVGFKKVGAAWYYALP